MKAHEYWSVGALITMLGTFYSGYKGSKSSSIHDIHAAVLVISRNHQNRHRENAFGDFQFCSHDNFSL